MPSPLPLAELPVLVVDAQATSADPGSGHVVELAWSKTRASAGSPAIESRVCRLPDGAELPPRVSQVTGLGEEEIQRGEDPAAVLEELLAAAEAVAREVGSRLCPTVIHFASFEERHLRSLHYRFRGDEPFPLRTVCTHAIAKRVLPGLPRLGLRAVSGYFSHGLSGARRSRQHVAATTAVWRGLLGVLEREHGVVSLDELLEWLSARPSAPRGRFFPMPEERRRELPREPGVYRMLRENGDVLYVGKAAVLEERVRSYFHRSAPHPEHVLEMLSQARDLSYEVTGSALEAALLEADEIKRLDPPYNRALRLRERKLLFSSRSFDRFAEACDEAHVIGPLGGGERLWRSFAALRACSEGRDASLSEILPSAAPDTLEAGFEEFRRRAAPSLFAHGAREWIPAEEPDEDETEIRLELQYGERAAPRATPEDVCESMNEVVRRATHLLRRAHWLVLVSESTLTWREGGGARIALLLHGGAVLERRTLESGAFVPEPRGWALRPIERRRRIDLPAYDRLTVLTAEMRRLTGEDRGLELHFRPGRCLDGRTLARMLRWV